MKIIQTTEYEGRPLWKPANESDLPMFMHCSLGLIASTEENLRNIIPVLNAHGIIVEMEVPNDGN